MRHTPLWVVATIIALVIIIGFVLSIPRTRDEGREPAQSTATTSVPTVTLHDAFKKGVHTITGFVDAPNACAVVSALASVTGTASSTDTGNIIVAISVSGDTGVCLQVPTAIPFQANVSAMAELPITVLVNGAVASTTASS